MLFVEPIAATHGGGRATTPVGSQSPFRRRVFRLTLRMLAGIYPSFPPPPRSQILPAGLRAVATFHLPLRRYRRSCRCRRRYRGSPSPASVPAPPRPPPPPPVSSALARQPRRQHARTSRGGWPAGPAWAGGGVASPPPACAHAAVGGRASCAVHGSALQHRGGDRGPKAAARPVWLLLYTNA